MIIGLVILNIGLRFYKAHASGIIFDEVRTNKIYAKDVHTALTCYNEPNNHVLNSIFICLARILFGHYEHYMRIFPVLFGTLFSISIAYIIVQLIESDLLKIMTTAILLFNWFVFDLTFPARGYAFALGFVYAGTALIFWLFKRKISFRHCWLIILIMVSMNFMALGAMLSSVYVLISLNFLFILFFVHLIFTHPPKRIVVILLNGSAVAVFSTLSLFLLYRHIYHNIIEVAHTPFHVGTTQFSEHMKELFFLSFRAGQSLMSITGYWILMALAFSGLIVIIFSSLSRHKKKTSNTNPITPRQTMQRLVFFTCLLTIVLTGINRCLLNQSVGYMRNGVILFPFFVLSIVILIDRLWNHFNNQNLAAYLLKTVITLILIGAVIQNRPSCYAVQIHDWNLQSISGPLLRRLRADDPNKEWKILITESSKYLSLCLNYYHNFGYHFKVYTKTYPNHTSYDFVIYGLPVQSMPDSWYFDRKFTQRFGCVIGRHSIAPPQKTF